MLKSLFILVVIGISITNANENKIDDTLSTKFHNKIFCGCTDQAYKEALTKTASTTTSFWERLKTILSVNKQDKCLQEKTIKCAANQVIKVIIASIGTSKAGSCLENNSSYESLHTSNVKTNCHEALRSTDSSAKLCDNKNECSILINTKFSSICPDSTDPKHLSIVYSCTDRKPEVESVKTLKLERIKRMNKFEKDKRNRDSLYMWKFTHLPFRWNYDALQKESFRNNRALWGTGQYDYYNEWNYETNLDNQDYYDYLERVYDDSLIDGGDLYDVY